MRAGVRYIHAYGILSLKLPTGGLKALTATLNRQRKGQGPGINVGRHPIVAAKGPPPIGRSHGIAGLGENDEMLYKLKVAESKRADPKKQSRPGRKK